ncbi:MAG: hypothetical protein ACP5HG_18120 [Anaerolineae bacterium]
MDIEQPWEELPEVFRDVLIYGSGDERIHFEYHAEGEDSSWSGKSYRPVQGAVYHINRLFHQTKSESTRRWYQSFMSERPCVACGGARLRPEALGVRVGDKTINDVGSMTIEEAHNWAQTLGAALSGEQREIGGYDHPGSHRSDAAVQPRHLHRPLR